MRFKKLLSLSFLLVIILMISYGCCLKHDWQPATCERPQICNKCGKTEGIPLGHNIGEWETIRERGDKYPGLKRKSCSKCGKTIEEEMIKFPYFDLTVPEYESKCSMLDSADYNMRYMLEQKYNFFASHTYTDLNTLQNNGEKIEKFNLMSVKIESWGGELQSDCFPDIIRYYSIVVSPLLHENNTEEIYRKINSSLKQVVNENHLKEWRANIGEFSFHIQAIPKDQNSFQYIFDCTILGDTHIGESENEWLVNPGEPIIEDTTEDTAQSVVTQETISEEIHSSEQITIGSGVLVSEEIFISNYQKILPVLSELLEQKIEIVYTKDNEGNPIWLHYIDGTESTIRLHFIEGDNSLMISCSRDYEFGAMLGCSASIMQLVSNLEGGFQKSLEITQNKMLEVLNDPGQNVSGLLLQGAIYDTGNMHYAFAMLGSKTMSMIVEPLS